MPTMFQAPLVAGSWDFRRCGASPPQEELLGCPFTSGGFLGSSAGHTSFDVPVEADACTSAFPLFRCSNPQG